MLLTESKLKQIVREEYEKIMKEAGMSGGIGTAGLHHGAGEGRVSGERRAGWEVGPEQRSAMYNMLKFAQDTTRTPESIKAYFGQSLAKISLGMFNQYVEAGYAKDLVGNENAVEKVRKALELYGKKE